MIVNRNKKLLVPVEISVLVYERKLIRPFAIFLALKFFGLDKVKINSPIFKIIADEINLKDSKGRAFKSHFHKLLKLNWIGFNSKTGVYHIRSMDFLIRLYGLEPKRGTEIFLQDLRKLQVYLAGVIINKAIYSQEHYWKWRRLRTAAHNREAAKQSNASGNSEPSYFGLSAVKIARLLGCSYTRANVMRQEAANAGYITSTHRFEVIALLNKKDFKWRENVKDCWPDYGKRLRFLVENTDGGRVIKIERQLHNEIKPLMPFKLRRKRQITKRSI